MPIDPSKFHRSHPMFRDGQNLPPDLEDAKGDLFDNQYRIIKGLGEGGMGTVFLVEDVVMSNRKEALKRIRPEFAANLEVRQRFIREVDLSQQIVSHHVVRVYGARQFGDELYYTMEYLEGETLRDRLDDLIDQDQIMKLDEIRRIITEICQGLDDAHRITVHRDLKPDNVFLQRTGSVKLLDFGLARALKGTGLTEDARRMGTAYYMAPEQMSRKKVDASPTMDIYSLGVMLYEMLTLRLPMGERIPSADIRDDLSIQMDEFISCCLSYQPSKRPQTVAEFLAGFDQALEKSRQEQRQRKQAETEQKIQLVRDKAADAVKTNRLDTALSMLNKVRQYYPNHDGLTQDIQDIESRMKEQEAERIREIERRRRLDKIQELERVGNLNQALDACRKMVSDLGEHSEITECMQRIQAAMDERDRLEQAEAKRRRREKAEAIRKKQEADEAKRQEEIRRQREQEKTEQAKKLRKGLFIGAGIIGVIFIIFMIVNGFGGKSHNSFHTTPNTQHPTPNTAKDPQHPIPNTEKSVDLGNNVSLDLVYIQGGTFKMGSPSSESGRSDDEGPVHSVTLDGFWMGKYEVTQGQYQAIMGENPSRFKGSNRPVERVSWNNAVEFCRKLSSRTGQTFTLPTEAQWEYACRAGSQTRFCFGDSDSGLSSYAWYASNSDSKTHNVGDKRANDWGLYDMHGNVWEWCSDWYDSDYYSKSPGRNPAGPGSGSGRVYRGGSWYDFAWLCRSAFRYRYSPSFTNNYLGFRVLRVAP